MGLGAGGRGSGREPGYRSSGNCNTHDVCEGAPRLGVSLVSLSLATAVDHSETAVVFCADMPHQICRR